MPRVTLKEYLDRRLKLVWAWQNCQYIFDKLLFHEQVYLHEYFRPAETLIEQELIQHWHDVRDSHNSLPQQAGKAYKALIHMPLNLTAREYAELQEKLPPRLPDERYSIAGAVRPRIDFEKLARVLMRIVEKGRGKS